MRSTSFCRMAGTVLAIVGIVVVASSAHADTIKKIRESGTIVLAHRESSVPFSYVNAQKEPMGYSLDLCAKIVEAVKRDLKLSKLKVTYFQVAAGERLAATRWILPLRHSSQAAVRSALSHSHLTTLGNFAALASPLRRTPVTKNY
jgi:hypothetical protein